MKTATVYWMVHKPQGGATNKMHETTASAMREARRLAEEDPGSPVFVLETVSAYCVEVPEAEAMKLRYPAQEEKKIMRKPEIQTR